MYYLRARPKADAIQFTVDQTALAKTKAESSQKQIIDKSTMLMKANPLVNDENALANRATIGLEYAAEPACENCSA